MNSKSCLFAAKAAECIRSEWPDVILEQHHGQFDADPGSAGNLDVVRRINAFQPDVLLVGMGMPRQELWVLENQLLINPCVVFTVGGAFDYEAGVQHAAPRWLGHMGGEWLYRLVRNPRRMYRRYCVEPWSLLGAAVSDLAIMFKTRFGGDRSAQPRTPPSSAPISDQTRRAG